MIPIQITNNQNNLQSSNMGPGVALINGKPGEACKGFNGNLNSWFYGLSPEYKKKLLHQQNTVGLLAQLDTVNSPYYTNVEVDPSYINFLKNIRSCN